MADGSDSLYGDAKRLLHLAVRIELCTTEAEENTLCDERDKLLAKFRAADDRLRAQAPVWRTMEEALRPFAYLLDTDSNGYQDSPDDEVVRAVGTLGRDYAFITVGDLRRARAALPAPPKGEGGE